MIIYKNKIIILVVAIIIILFSTIFLLQNYRNKKAEDYLTKDFKTNILKSAIEGEDINKKDNGIIVVVLNKRFEKEAKEKQEEEQTNIQNIESEEKKEEKEIKNTNNEEYYIKINTSANVVNIYNKDENGNYTIPYKAMVCSAGEKTPKSGIYEIDYKYRWLGLVGNVYGQYCTRIVGNILFHSVPYKTNKNPGSLKSEEYDKLGQLASSGCIRLKVEDAKWIYDNISKKTKVEFYEDQNPGPLGKPELLKISNYDEPYKNWDPTDPDVNNPWINFAE